MYRYGSKLKYNKDYNARETIKNLLRLKKIIQFTRLQNLRILNRLLLLFYKQVIKLIAMFYAPDNMVSDNTSEEKHMELRPITLFIIY